MAGDGIDAFITFSKGKMNGQRAPAVEGEAQDKVEKEYTSSQILSYAFSFALEGDQTEETSTQTHHPKANEVTVTKMVDTASPTLFQNFCGATQYDNVWIYQRRAGGLKGMSGDYFWMITLGDVTVTSLRWDGDGYPRETIGLHFEELWVDYVGQKHTGALDQSKAKHGHFDWHSAPNKMGGSGQVSDVDIDAAVERAIEKLRKAGKLK
jgi:type VI protein secretion system component Hcp